MKPTEMRPKARKNRDKAPHVAAFLLLAVFGCNASAQDDPGGWTLAKWGMSQEQLKLKFPQSTIYTSRRSGSVFGIPEYEIKGMKCHVEFEFDKDKTLVSVVLTPAERSPTDATKDVPPNAVAEAAKISLLSGLRDNYGQPMETTESESRDQTGGLRREWRWIFQTTMIVLAWNSHANPAYQQLDRTTLIYEKRIKRSDL